MGKNNPEVGFMTPIKTSKVPTPTTSDAQKAKDTALRAKQDLQAAKERESDRGRFNKQVQGAKSNTSISTPDPYAKSEAPIKPARSLQDVLNKPVDQTSFLSKLKESDRASANSKYANTHDFKGDTSLDVSNPKNKSDVVSAPKAKAAPAPKVKSQFEKMQSAYEGFGKGSDSAANKAIQSRIEGKGVAKTPAMKKGGKVKPKCFAKGGSVRSASSRGDGCATKGHTRGVMR